MPTTNPVPSTDPSDLLFNAGKLDEVVNGTANSFTDRLGVARRTVAGMNADFDAQLADAESDLNVYRSDAAASAAQALGYLNTIRATSYGAYASDPATDPLGNPPTVGDEYFNTTAKLLKRWNGTTWQASDINTANLAASSGSSLVGYDGGTVQDVLDGAKSLQDYAALRAYTGRATRVYITGPLVTAKPAGIAGVFQYDPTDTTSADNGGTIIVDAGGRRWKRDYSGSLNVAWFGAVGVGEQSQIAAFAAAGAELSDGDSLYVPDGDYVFDFSTYTVTSPVYPLQGIVQLTNKTGIKIYGTGARLRITNLDTRTKGGWSIIHSNNSSRITVEGLSFDVHGVIGLDVAVPEPGYPIVGAVTATGTSWKNFKINGCEFSSYNPLGSAPNPSGNNFTYKQIPVFAQGDSNSDAVRGFKFTNNVMRDTNTYKIFLLGVGKTKITDNDFLNISGLYPCVRNLVHASRGHKISGNNFEGADPINDVPSLNIRATDLPSMVWFTTGTNKGGGGVSVVDNTFALTGSGGIAIGDCKGASVVDNTFYDLVDMSSILTIEDDTKAAIRLFDEATGFGSYPATNVTVSDNTVIGVISRKVVEVKHALNGSIHGNSFSSAAGCGIKASRARKFSIYGNTISDVSSLGGIQIGIFVNSATGVLTDSETVSVFDNTISGSAGIGIDTSGFTTARVKINNNRVLGGMTERGAGAQDQLKTDYLNFSNDATRVSSNANSLDWYEEGTFTPAIAGTSFAGSGTYTRQIGQYTRIGDTVHFQIAVVWTMHTGTGNTTITGLPFVSKTASGKFTPCTVWQVGGPILGANKIRIAQIGSNSSTIDMRETDVTTMATSNSNAITATGEFYISGTYKV